MFPQFLFFCSLERFRNQGRGDDVGVRRGVLTSRSALPLPSWSMFSLLPPTLNSHFPPLCAPRRKQRQNTVSVPLRTGKPGSPEPPRLADCSYCLRLLLHPTCNPWPLGLCALPGPLLASNLVSLLNHHHRACPELLYLITSPPTMAGAPQGPALGHLFSRRPQTSSESWRLSHFPKVEPSPGQT